MHRLECAEIWGGIDEEKADIASPGIIASLFATSGDGSKGGDIYYLTLCNSTYITRMAIADVVGHGEDVSEMSQSLYHSLKNHVDNLNGNDVLTDLNKEVVTKGIKAITTAAVTTYYRDNGSCSFTYAGHPPMLIKSKDVKIWQEAKVSNEKDNELKNIPLAVDPGAKYIQDSMILNKGDRILMYTDGLLEALSLNGDRFGMQRLMETLDENGDKPLDELRDQTIKKLCEYTSGKIDHDDVTLLFLEIR